MSWMGTLKICFEYLTRDSETGSWSSRATKGVEVRRRSFIRQSTQNRKPIFAASGWFVLAVSAAGRLLACNSTPQ